MVEQKNIDDSTKNSLLVDLSGLDAKQRFLATSRLVFCAPRSAGKSRSTVFLQPVRDGRQNQVGNSFGSFAARPEMPALPDETDSVDDGETIFTRRTRRTRDRDSANTRISSPQKLTGSTRIEAKRQRRKESKEISRNRQVVTEFEFTARRESVRRDMLVRSGDDILQLGVLEDDVLVEHYVARSREVSLIGNVYLGRVQNVLPSMEAAFVDIGEGRNAVLYSGEVDWSESGQSKRERKIEEVLKPGDTVLVQVTKDPVGQKGARLTSQISLPGRFVVYLPGGGMNGISRKLPETERARLKTVLKKAVPQGSGVIVRTAAEGASDEQLTSDVERLTAQWETIEKQVSVSRAPKALHAEPDMLIKIVRDIFNEDFNRLLIEGEQIAAQVRNYLQQVAPELLERVEVYTDKTDIFKKFRVTEQISKALDRKVWLPSGGSLVIDRTEAMTVIDVNTGRFVGQGGNLEETVTMNNLEAAEEIVRQLRLRDIGGIVVIDFIDMVLENNRDLVHSRLTECLSRDRTKHQVSEVTSLGLVQMTRKKLGLGLLESFSSACRECAGRGVIVQHEPTLNGQNKTQTKKQVKNQTVKPQQAKQLDPGVKNMLAQVAASTVHPEQTPEPVPSHAAIEPITNREPVKHKTSPTQNQNQNQHSLSEDQRSEHSQREHSQDDSQIVPPKRGGNGRAGRKTAEPNTTATSDVNTQNPTTQESLKQRVNIENPVNGNTQRPQADTAPAPKTDAEESAAPQVREPEELFELVLEALPEAPARGARGARRRRASLPQKSIDG